MSSVVTVETAPEASAVGGDGAAISFVGWSKRPEKSAFSRYGASSTSSTSHRLRDLGRGSRSEE